MVPSWLLNFEMTSSRPARLTGPWPYAAPSTKALLSGYFSANCCRPCVVEGMTPKASANFICCSGVMRLLTRSTAAAWLGDLAATPQQLVNISVPLPAGPAGSSTVVYLTFG